MLSVPPATDALTSADCDACAARYATAQDDPPRPAEHITTGFWQRFLIASIPAAVLALFVESTLYGYVLYLGVYLTYCAWGEATSPCTAAGNRQPSAQSHGQQLTANS